MTHSISKALPRISRGAGGMSLARYIMREYALDERIYELELDSFQKRTEHQHLFLLALDDFRCGPNGVKLAYHQEKIGKKCRFDPFLGLRDLFLRAPDIRRHLDRPA